MSHKLEVFLLITALSYFPCLSQIQPNLKERFKAIQTLEEIYYHEYMDYAPNIKILKSHFSVVDPIEFIEPNFELYVGKRNREFLIAAIDDKGDSIVQLGKDSTYTANLNQLEYCVNNYHEIDKKKELIINLSIEKCDTLYGKLSKNDKELFNFRFFPMKSKQILHKGNKCIEYLKLEDDGNNLLVHVKIQQIIAMSKNWEFNLFTSKDQIVKGHFKNINGKKYTIYGNKLPSESLRIFSKPSH